MIPNPQSPRPLGLIRRILLASLLLPALALPASAAPSTTAVRIRDLTMVAGARDNQLVGYGLVVGLAGDGDKDPVYAKQTLANLLQRFGVTVPAAALSSKNVAVVMVTADIPAFIKPGARLDIQVASLSDAKSLQGGVLLQTPMFGADNQVYAVAQGPLAVGGFTGGTGGAGGASVTKNHPTVGMISSGALVEREIPVSIVQNNSIEFLLRDPGYTTAARLAAAVNEKFPDSAQAIDATSIKVLIPSGAETRVVDFIARVEGIEVYPDTPARVIINERTGTIVATARIKISQCAISHGNLVISISSTPEASQPNALSNTGETAVLNRTKTQVDEPKTGMVILPELPTVEKVATALNGLGVSPRDMMAIFQAMKQAGALQAELHPLTAMNASPLSPVTGSAKYADVPLDRLASNPKVPQGEKLAAACKAFEAVLLRQILESAHKPVVASTLTPSSASSSIYRDLVSSQMADQIAATGQFGLARSFLDQIKGRQSGTGAAPTAANAAAPAPVVGRDFGPAILEPKGFTAAAAAPEPAATKTAAQAGAPAESGAATSPLASPPILKPFLSGPDLKAYRHE